LAPGISYNGAVYQAVQTTNQAPGGPEWTAVSEAGLEAANDWTEWNQILQANVITHGPHPYIDTLAPPFTSEAMPRPTTPRDWELVEYAFTVPVTIRVA